MSSSKPNKVNKGPTSLYPEYRSRKLGPMEPLIRIDWRLMPRWIGWFTLLITFAWLLYGIYMRIEPAFDGPSRFERYIDRKYPELDVFAPENEIRSAQDPVAEFYNSSNGPIEFE